MSIHSLLFSPSPNQRCNSPLDSFPLFSPIPNSPLTFFDSQEDPIPQNDHDNEKDLNAFSTPSLSGREKDLPPSPLSLSKKRDVDEAQSTDPHEEKNLSPLHFQENFYPSKRPKISKEQIKIENEIIKEVVWKYSTPESNHKKLKQGIGRWKFVAKKVNQKLREKIPSAPLLPVKTISSRWHHALHPSIQRRNIPPEAMRLGLVHIYINKEKKTPYSNACNLISAYLPGDRFFSPHDLKNKIHPLVKNRRHYSLDEFIAAGMQKLRKITL